MAGPTLISEMLKLQRKRIVASVLGHCERAPWYGKLSRTETDALREAVIAATNSYHEIALDLLKVGAPDDTVIISERAVELIEAVHQKIG